MQLLRTDPDLGTEAEFKAVGKAGRGIDIDAGAVHAADKNIYSMEISAASLSSVTIASE